MNRSADPKTYDAAIIGAGPTGLTAATYLARFHRKVIVLDGGASRARWIPNSHNTPGFPHGVGGEDLLQRLRLQAATYGALIRPGLVEGLTAEKGGFRLSVGETQIAAANVVLATGVVDRLPPIPDVEAAIRDSRVRICPICDAYEASGARIAVLGDDDLAQREAAFLRSYSQDVTVLSIAVTEPRTAHAVGSSDLRLEDDCIVFAPQGQAAQTFDYLYLALGCTAQVELAVSVGARLDETGKLKVDDHQMTTVEGLYAAGDVVRGLNQIAVGAGEAAIAATAVHNRLRADRA